MKALIKKVKDEGSRVKGGDLHGAVFFILFLGGWGLRRRHTLTMYLMLSPLNLTPPLSMEIRTEMHKHPLRDGFMNKEPRKECIKPVIVTSLRC